MPRANTDRFGRRGRKFFFWGGGFPIDDALYSIAFWSWELGPIQKPLNRSRCRLGYDEWALPEEQCVTWGNNPRREGAIFGENVPDKPIHSLICEMDWSMQPVAAQGR